MNQKQVEVDLYCDRCKGRGFYYGERTIEWTWEHGFKEPKIDEIFKIPCLCGMEKRALKRKIRLQKLGY